MSRIARLIAPVVAAAALAVAGGSQALAAAPTSLDLADAWCFDDTPGYVYCFDVTGKAEFVDSKPGSWVSIHQRVVTVISKDGAVVGTSTDLTNDKFTFDADGNATYHTVTNTKSSFLDETCHYQSVLRISDFDLKIDHVNSSCGS
jgi:hypothetical protein